MVRKSTMDDVDMRGSKERKQTLFDGLLLRNPVAQVASVHPTI